MLKKPELLLPAGTLEHMRYAYDFGADAIYAGQPRYSLRARNNEFKLEQFRTAIKKVLKAINLGDKSVAQSEYVSAQSVIDKIARKGIFHRNKAARHKSRLSARIKALA